MEVRMLRTKILSDFPSGSAIEYFKDKIYLIGDDATHILIMNKEWKVLERLQLFKQMGDRVPKDTKADLESATIINKNTPQLLLLGSGSKYPYRYKSISVNLEDNKLSESKMDDFYDAIRSKGVNELNIESSAIIGDQVLLCNRANNTNRQNQLIIAPVENLGKSGADIKVIPVELILKSNIVGGISGMCYDPESDRLLMTASVEDTKNAYDDGAIGDSYLTVVNQASKKLSLDLLRMDLVINLSGQSPSFKSNKIESVCIEKSSGDKMILHMTADNDQGNTVLFKARLSL